MKHYILLSLLVLIPSLSHGQQCSCEDKFNFVKTQIATNYAGYKDKVSGRAHKGFESFTAAQLKKVKKTTKAAPCFMLIHEWLDFFKDGHVQLAGNPDNDKDSLVMMDRIKNTEVIDLSEEQIEHLKNSKIPEEGIYIISDSTYTIAIIKSRNDYRDFAGVILTSKNTTWKKGQVKLELKSLGNNKYAALMYFRDHSYRVQDFTFDGKSFNDEWRKIGQEQNAYSQPPSGPVSAKKMNDTTFYVQIGTFDGGNARAIDSVFATSMFLLKATPNLILDLRGNGGGSDFSYRPIIHWLYTDPIVTTGVDVLCTPDNINGTRKLVLDNPDVPEDMKAETRQLVAAMEKNTGKFIESNGDDTLEQEYSEPNPRRIVILIDRGTGSSAEQFLLLARQSRKVTLMGEHSAGILDYANMRPSAPSPCKDLALYYATTRSRRIAVGRGIDNVGIQPNVLLTKDKDWVAEALKYLAR
jgi:hypothetical protein